MTTQAEIVDRMLEWFEDEAHWHKGGMGFRDAKGQPFAACLIGSVNVAMFGDIAWARSMTKEEYAAHQGVINRMHLIAAEQFPERMAHGVHNRVADFNDDRRTTIEEVRGLLEKLRAQVQEEG